MQKALVNQYLLERGNIGTGVSLYESAGEGEGAGVGAAGDKCACCYSKKEAEREDGFRC